MRIIEPEKRKKEPQEEPQVEQQEEQKEEKKETSFNDLLVEEIGKECYSINYFSSLGIAAKSMGLCGIAEFFWHIAEKTMCAKKKIKEYLLIAEHEFAYPAIDAVKVENGCLFCQAVDHENETIERLYKLMDKAPCECTKSLVAKVIEKHGKILHILSLAQKIRSMSEDKLLVQQEVEKLICETKQ